MARSFTYEALVLRARPAGESNREAWFLTREEGILKATVFGGPKSRLRAYVSPFHQGTLWVYHNPVRDYRTVTDFDVRCWRPGLREQYERIETAGTVAETALASFGGGGDWERALGLAGSALDALSEADAACCSRILIHFLWNWLDFLGLTPDIRHCASCACEYPAHGVVLFGGPDGTLRCPSCAGSEEGLIPVGPGARRWLAAVSPLSPSALKRYTLDRASRSQALALATGLTAYALGRPPAGGPSPTVS
jgi:DNA repair protein RecO (recombination protein O)